MLSDFGRNVRRYSFSLKVDVYGPKLGVVVNFNCSNPRKAHPCMISHLLIDHTSKLV